MANADTLVAKLDDIGDAIRAKTGKTAKMTLDEMPDEIAGISGDEKTPFRYVHGYYNTLWTSTTVSHMKRLTVLSGDSSIQKMVESFDYSGASDFSCFMNGQTSMTSFDFAWIADASPRYFNNMFRSCFKLEEIKNADAVSPSVSRCPEMFTGCVRLKSIDLSTWDFSNVTSGTYGTSGMFSDCTALELLKLPSSWQQVSNSPAVFPVAMYDEAGTAYDSGAVIPAGAHTYTITDPTA